MSEFEKSINTLLEHEGGYVDHPTDPGGETKFGISKRSYPNVDIKNLTREGAIEIYRRDWWEKNKYEQITSQAVATKVFDAAINMGANQAHKLLQQAANACGAAITVDGALGAASIDAINKISSNWLLDRFRVELVVFYASLVRGDKKRIVFLLGWVTRAIS